MRRPPTRIKRLENKIILLRETIIDLLNTQTLNLDDQTPQDRDTIELAQRIVRTN